MCGIAGILNLSTRGGSAFARRGADFGGKSNIVDLALLQKMTRTLIHRGPDSEGYYTSGPIGLGMRRLSIIDLTTGDQPMTNKGCPKAQGPVYVICNGEIYNFQSLRADLERIGHRFKTKSDIEVILHLYEDHGSPEFLKYLRGMYALALWDEGAQRLFLARDRIGKKPLVYAKLRDEFLFASEIKALLQHPDVSREINLKAIDYYLTYQYIPSPMTIFTRIKKLPPAHHLNLKLEDGGWKMEVGRYWEPPFGSKLKISEEEASQELLRILKEATRLRMIADVPLGAFLSGGVDSSVVVALMSELSNRPVKTFTIGFEEENFSEVHYAREVAQIYKTDHHEFIVKAENAEILPKIAYFYDEPYADSSALPSYYVARETRRHVTVALNGDGGDENFAGYIRYQAMLAARFADWIPLGLRKAFYKGIFSHLPEKNAPYGFFWRLKRLSRLFLEESSDRYLDTVRFFSQQEKDCLYSLEMKQALGPQNAAIYLREALDRAPSQDFLNKLLWTDFETYLPEDLMVKMDIATMANSLEGRSPFLDQEVVEFCCQLPSRFKLRRLRQSKYLLKKTMAQKLPKTILGRGKMGFGIPLGAWFRNGLRTTLRETVLSSRAFSRNYFKRDVLETLVQEHIEGKRDHGYHLWALLMLELWHQVILEKG